MESAFGVEHSEVSKGVPQGLVQAAKGPSAPPYAIARMAARKQGRLAGKEPARTLVRTWAQDAGKSARAQSRGALLSKGVPKGLLKVVEKNPRLPLTGANPQHVYAHERVAAHKAGRDVTGVKAWRKAKLPAEAFPHTARATRSTGERARIRSRLVAS